MSKKQEETVIRNEILDYLNFQYNTLMLVFYNGAIYDPKIKRYRNKGKYSRDGVTDLVGTYRGKPLGIEVKVPGEKPSKEQLEFHQEARSKGWIIIVATSVADVIQGLKGI